MIAVNLQLLLNSFSHATSQLNVGHVFLKPSCCCEISAELSCVAQQCPGAPLCPAISCLAGSGSRCPRSFWSSLDLKHCGRLMAASELPVGSLVPLIAVWSLMVCSCLVYKNEYANDWWNTVSDVLNRWLKAIWEQVNGFWNLTWLGLPAAGFGSVSLFEYEGCFQWVGGRNDEGWWPQGSEMLGSATVLFRGEEAVLALVRPAAGPAAPFCAPGLRPGPGRGRSVPSLRPWARGCRTAPMVGVQLRSLGCSEVVGSRLLGSVLNPLELSCPLLPLFRQLYLE